jgi:glycerol-3-phosphate dehydrogenase
VYALEREWAVTLEDLLQRRCMAGLNADFGLGAARGASAALTRLSIWDEVHAAAEQDAYRALAARHRVPTSQIKAVQVPVARAGRNLEGG